MIGFVIVLRRVNGAGFADRLNVGGRAFLLLFMGGLLGTQLQTVTHERFAAPVLLLGALLCLAGSGLLKVARRQRSRGRMIASAALLVPVLAMSAFEVRPVSAPS